MTPRSLALLAALSALLAGCAQSGTTPSPEEEVDPLDGYEVPLVPRGPEIPTCATLSLRSPANHPAGEPLLVRLVLENCGGTPIPIEPRACADPPRGFVLDIYPEGDDYGYTLTAEGARRVPLPCQPTNETTLQLAPGETFIVERAWDTRLPPATCAPDATCPPVPAPPGAYTLAALAPYGRKLAQAEAQLTLVPPNMTVPLLGVVDTHEPEPPEGTNAPLRSATCVSLDDAERRVTLATDRARVPLALLRREHAHPTPEGGSSEIAWLVLDDALTLGSLIEPGRPLATIASEGGAFLIDEAPLAPGETTSRAWETPLENGTRVETLTLTHLGEYTLRLEPPEACPTAERPPER